MITVASKSPRFNYVQRDMLNGRNGSGDGDRFGAADGADIVEAFCRAQRAVLSRGGRGVSAAMDLLVAFPAACRLGWSDMTVSAPQLFRMLENAGLISSYPTASDIPPAFRLVESAGGLVTQRSPRRWTCWFSSACDPDHVLGASIRAAVTPAMLKRQPSQSPPESSPRKSSIREDRDQLARELDSLRSEFVSLQARHRKTRARLERARSLTEQLKQSHAQTTEQLEESRIELESVRSTSSHIQARRDELRRRNRELAQRTESLAEELAVAQKRATRSDSEREREREQARLETSQLRAAKQNLEQERAGLRAQISKLQRQGAAQEDRISSLRDDVFRLCREDGVVRSALDGIQEIFDIECFDPETPETFVQAIDQVFQEAKERTTHVAAACARVLDRRTIQWLLLRAKLDVLRDEDLPLATIDRYFENRPQAVFDKFGKVLEKMRSNLAAEGVVLPPTELTREDLCS